MTVTLENGVRHGTVKVPSSKSQAHRALIASALGRNDTVIICDGISKDIAATADCLNALGADIRISGETITVSPIKSVPEGVCRLECGESGSTLRFLIPVVGALGADAEFYPKGRLIERPLAPMDSELISKGMRIEKTDATIKVSGRLEPGVFTIAGNVSSQYITGLLMALPLLRGDSELVVTGDVQSKNYIKMTEDVLISSAISFEKHGNSYTIPGCRRPCFPGRFQVEGDYSGASFFLCMGALSEAGITVKGLDPDSCQGDKAILGILKSFGADVVISDDGVTVRKNTLSGITIDASQIPDIIPPLCVVAAAANGQTRIINAERLRIKESDRLATTTALLRSLGGDVSELPDGLIINGKGCLDGGEVDSFNDHRIAMSAAVAACICNGRVAVDGAECVSKSYPRFWEDLASLSIK